MDEEKMRREHTAGKRIVISVVGVMLLFMVVALFYGEGITGAAVLDTGIVVSTNTTLDLGENVTSLRVTGSVSGSGQIALYLGERIVFDTATLDTTLLNYCMETCEVALGAGSLRAVVEGDALLIVTSFNYTSEETVVTIPDETSDEINQTIGDGNETDETNQTLNLTNETNQIHQTDGETDDEMDETIGTDTAQEIFNGVEDLNFEPLFLVQPSPANTSEVFIQADVTSCQTISSSGMYTLTQDISATDSCILIQAENVTLDCRGYAITYGTVDSNSVVGIWAEDSPSQAMNNITIKNCRIFAGDRSNTQQTAIYAENISSSTIFNNTIAANGTDESMGIWLYNSSSVNITDNAVTTQSVGGSSSYGIYFQMTPNSFAVNNSVRTNGTTINYAMRITSTSPYEVIYNNNVTTNGDTYGIGIYAESNGNNISSNRINTNGFNEQNWGLYVSGSNNRIDSNTIRTDGSFRNYGIYLFDSENNTVHSNTINTRGGAGGGNRNYGILAERSSNNTMWLNTIATYGNFSNYGVFLYNYSSSNNISWNTIYTYSNGSTGSSFGVYLLEYAQSNAVASNLIVTNGTFREDGIIITTLATANNISGNSIIVRSVDESYGIYLHTGADNNAFARNNITFNDTISSAGIRIENSSHNTFFLENINVTSARSVEIETQHQRGGQVLNNTLTNITFIRTNMTIDFIVYNGTRIKSMNSSEAPTGPNGQTALGKYVNITNTTAWSWVFVNISYLDVEVPATVLNESLLRVWKYNSSNQWTNASFFTVNEVVPALNSVYANITTFSLFGVFGTIDASPDVSSLLPVSSTMINKSTSIEIAATVTDDRIVQNVTANITLPNGTQVKLFLGNASTHATKYNISFAVTDLIGLYNVTFLTNDSSGNINATERTNFTVVNRIPIINIATLNTTNVTLNDTTVNLTLYLNVTDDDRHSVKNITNWLINAVSWTRLLMLFERINSTAWDNAYDYSGHAHNASVIGAVWNATAGFDGRGAYEFGNGYIEVNSTDALGLTSAFTISAWVKPRALRGTSIILDKSGHNVTKVTKTNTQYNFGIYGWKASLAIGEQIAIGDVNNDGINDIIFDSPDNTVQSVILGPLNTTGEINSSNINRSIGTGAGKVGYFTFADINRDGLRDLITTTSGCNTHCNLSVFYVPLNMTKELNQSDANITYNGTRNQIASGDFNGDGIDDIIADDMVDGSGTTGILFGPFPSSTSWLRTNLTFASSTTPAGSQGDVNGDGQDDVVMDNGEIYYGPFNLSGNISVVNVTISSDGTNRAFSSAAVGDLNDDGVDDVVLGASLSGLGSSLSGAVQVFFGPLNQSGNFSYSIANVTITSSTMFDAFGSAVAVGDLNNDGVDDLAVGASASEQAGGPSGQGEIFVYYGPLQSVRNYHLSIRDNESVVFSLGNESLKARNTFEVNEYYHIAAVYTGTEMRIFVNGKLNNTRSATQPLTANNFPLSIGSFLGADVGRFNGTLDDIALYGRALSPEQIFTIFQNGTFIDHNETASGDAWSSIVVPNDGFDDGASVQRFINIKDETPPSWQYNITNTTLPKVGTHINFSVNWTDASGLSVCGFQMANDTLTNFNVSRKICTGSNVNVSFTVIINATFGQTVKYLFWANDTSDNFNFTSEMTLHIVNSLPVTTQAIITGRGSGVGSGLNVSLSFNTTDPDRAAVTSTIVWFGNSSPVMVLNMPFEGINGTASNNAKDYAGVDNNGSEYGDIAWRSGGGYNRSGAYIFDGIDDYINISDNTSLDFGSTKDFSIIMWINTSFMRADQTLLFKGVTGQTSYGLFVNKDTGLVNATIDDGTNDVSVVSTSNVTNGSWYFVAATYNRTGLLSVYINGRQENTASISAVGSIDNNDYLAVGSRLNSSGTGLYFNGTIDHVQIWNRSLKAEQIFSIFSNRTDIVANETIFGDRWHAIITPNDGTEDGEPTQSNIFTISDAPLASANISNSTLPRYGESVNFSIIWTDPDGMSACGFQIANDTINYVNVTSKDCSGTTVNSSFIIRLNATRDQAIPYHFWANDTSGYVGMSAVMTIHMGNSPPVARTQFLNSTAPLINDTLANVTLYLNITDVDTDEGKNFTNWIVNGISWTRLMLSFEKNGLNKTLDYSGYGNNGTVVNATWNATGGYDGHGAYEFSSGYIDVNGSLNITNGFTLSVWVKPNSFSQSQRIVMKGGHNNTIGEFDLSSAPIMFTPANTSFPLGEAVGSGDFNNDGIDDIIMSGSTNSIGEAYIVYGPLNSTASINLTRANVTIQGSGKGNRFVHDVGSGDFNNDGIDDAIIVNGSATAFTRSSTISILFGPFTSGFINSSNANITALGAAASSGDFNNDGIADLIVGKENAGSGGEAYLFYGPLNSGYLDISANVTFFGVNESDFAGYAVASGDFNNDGIDDAIIGAPQKLPAPGTSQASDPPGKAYILYGPFNGSASINLSLANVTFSGINYADRAGNAVSSGDINMDGAADAIIGAYSGENTPGTHSRNTYIVNGPFNGSAYVDLSRANITFLGLGISAASVGSGDFNNDGADDIVIGSRSDKNYVFYGPRGYIGNFDLMLVNNSVSFIAGSQGLKTEGALRQAAWTHVTAVYSSTGLTLYINGILNATKIVNTNLSINSFGVTIGAFTGGLLSRFNGTLDELIIYNRSLTSEQILAMHANQTTILVANETNLHDVWSAIVTPHDGEETGTASQSNNITIRESSAPAVTSITPISYSIHPAGRFIVIGATVTDNDVLLDVQANVTYSNGSYFNYTLNNGSGYASTFNRSFFVPEVYDTYNITIIATDRDGNINSTQTTTFNVTYFDFDNDGLPDNVNDTVVGNITSVVSSGVTNLNISIDGNTNLSRLVDGGYRHFAFYDGGTLLFNFTHNMSASTRLALSNVSITIASNSVIINMSGLLARNETKTVYIADNSFTALCVKDEQIPSVDSISTDCDGTNETLFTQCLGNSTGVKNNTIRCIDEGSRIRFENMSHSGIRGTVASGEGGGGSGGGGSGGGSSSGGSSPSFGSGSAGGGAAGSAGAAAPAASGGTSTPFSARAVGSEIAQAAKAEQTEQEARPIRDIEVEFTNEGSETLTNLALGVGATEKIQRVTGDITRLEARTQEFERFVHYLLDHIRPKSGSAGNAVTGSAVAEVHAPEITGDIIASAKDQSEQLKEFLDGLKVTINVTFDEPEEINEQIAQVKVTIDIFVVRLDDSYNKGTLYENVDALAETSSSILSKVEAIKKEIASELDSLIIAQTENYNPIYPTKIVAMNAGPFRVTKKAVNPEVITAQLLGNVVIDKIAPGETFKQKLQVKLPFTALEKVPVDVVYSTFGQEIARETVTFDLPKKVAASTIYAGDGVLDIYAIISDAPGQSNSTYDAAIDKIFSQDLTIEVVINKNNGGHTVAVEWFGPYPLQSSESILLTQQFAYDKSFIDDYEIEFIFRRGASIVARQKHALLLKQSCIEQCSEESCAACQPKGSILFVGIHAIAAAVILAALFLMYAVWYGFDSSNKSAQLLELPGSIYRKIVPEEKVIDYDREERMIEKELRELNVPQQKIMILRKPTLLKMKKPKPSIYAERWNKEREGIKDYSTEEKVIERKIEQMKSGTSIMQYLRKQSPQPSLLKIDMRKPKPSPYAKHWRKHHEISKKYSKEEKKLNKEIEKLKSKKSK